MKGVRDNCDGTRAQDDVLGFEVFPGGDGLFELMIMVVGIGAAIAQSIHDRLPGSLGDTEVALVILEPDYIPRIEIRAKKEASRCGRAGAGPPTGDCRAAWFSPSPA